MTTSFRESYGVLQRNAQTLRNQSEPNIDDLLTIVTQSVAAYKVCKERIDAVEAALKTALDGAGMEAAPEPTVGRTAPLQEKSRANPDQVQAMPPSSSIADSALDAADENFFF